MNSLHNCFLIQSDFSRYDARISIDSYSIDWSAVLNLFREWPGLFTLQLMTANLFIIILSLRRVLVYRLVVSCAQLGCGDRCGNKRNLIDEAVIASTRAKRRFE